MFRNIKELAQTHVGRKRLFVEETYQFKSKKAVLKAEEDFKIDAEKFT